MPKVARESYPYVMSVRLDEELNSKVERELQRLRDANPGVSITLGDAIRAVLARGLQAA